VQKSRIGLGLALAAGLAAGGGAELRAQVPGHPAARPTVPVPRYTRSANFRLPIQLDERVRANLREIRFYVRRHPGEWVLQETAPPTQSGFVFKAPADGEYWFQFVLVDREGRLSPPRVERVPPALMVMVDTQAPEVEVLPARSGTGQALLQCNLRDANPDYSTTRLEYQAADGRWVPLQPLAGADGLFPAPDGNMAGARVRVAAADRAGNAVTRELTVPGPTVAGEPTAMPATLASAAPLPTPPAHTTVVDKPLLPVEPTPTVVPAVAMTPAPPAPTQLPTPTPTPSAPVGNGTAESPQLIGSTRCTLAYSVEPMGGPPGKVEVWATRDHGRSWLYLGEDADKQSPAELDLPGEGVYGLTIVVLRTGQAGGQAPAAGEAPDWWVEVDTTKPDVRFLGAQLGEGAPGLHITWSAADKNLGENCVQLSYAAGPAGPWQPIVSGHPNTGRFDWVPPPTAGSSAFLRVEATDKAGNVGSQDSGSAVALAAPRPKAKVTGVVAAR
jgi:hypothetical protein